MNLWVKRTGQLFIAALFMMSCEDDSFLLGFKNQNKKFNVRQKEFILSDLSSVILVDSIATDNFSGSDRVLIGEYFDPRFGTVRSEGYTQIAPSDLKPLETGAVFDSAVLQLRLDFYSYGSEGESVEEFTVHELTEAMEDSTRFFYHSTLAYNAFSLGQASSEIIYDSLQKKLGTSDTLMFKVRLDDSFAQTLVTYTQYRTDSVFAKRDLFKTLVKGLVFTPTQSNMILGFSTSSPVSNVTLYYHTPTTDSLKKIYSMAAGSVNFSNITTNRTGDLAGLTEPNQGVYPASGYRYLQNGTPVITKLDITPFYDYITGPSGDEDSLTNIIINSAELSVGIETPPDGMPPPSTITLRIMNDEDDFPKEFIDSDSSFMKDFYVVNDFVYYYPIHDDLTQNPSAVTLSYSSSKQKYVGYISLFLQNLFSRKERDRIAGTASPRRLYYLGLVPTAPTPGKTLNRAVINPNSIKLKINYTNPIIKNIE